MTLLMTQDVFISYARKDGSEAAAWLDRELQGRGFKTWRDTRQIGPSHDFTSEIELGIRQSRVIAVCITEDSLRQDAFVRREIQYALALKKPVIPLRFEDITPHISIINNEWLDFFHDREKFLDRFCEILGQPDKLLPIAETSQSVPVLSDPFRPYLQALYNEVVDYLKATVFTEIQVHGSDTPEAVAQQPKAQAILLRMGFKARHKTETVDSPVTSFQEGFEKHGGRVLLLGEPGAGKTTSLMAFLRDAIANRLNDASMPLPLFMRCAVWDSARKLSLRETFAEMLDLDGSVLDPILQQGKALILLDGLDELGVEREEIIEQAEHDGSGKPKVNVYDPRERFLALIPANNQLVISCRVKDYEEIGVKAPLNGAVTLMRLSDEQIYQYLVGKTELWSVLEQDNTLRDIARIPLLLSLLTFAFESAPEALKNLKTLRSSELRNAIFQQYLEERYRHEEERQSVALAFSVFEIQHLLGFVAYRNQSLKESENVLAEKDFSLKWGEESVNAEALIELGLKLHLLVQDANGSLRFIHLLLRDYFASAHVRVRLLDEQILELREKARFGTTRFTSPAIVLAQLDKTQATPLLLDALKTTGNREILLGILEALEKLADAQALRELEANFSRLPKFAAIRTILACNQNAAKPYYPLVGNYRLYASAYSNENFDGFRAYAPDNSSVLIKLATITDETKSTFYRQIVDIIQLNSHLLRVLSHPRLLRLRDYRLNEFDSWLVLDTSDTLETLYEYLEVRRKTEAISSPDWDFASAAQKYQEGTKPIAQLELMNIAQQIAWFLKYLHEHRLIHRDIKPDNIFRNQAGKLFIGDLSLVDVMGKDTYAMMGTEGYAPPEQYKGKNVAATSDIYGLGATLHQLATGADPRLEPPFSFVERPIENYNQNISVKLRLIIMKMLNFNQSERYQSIDDLLEDLATCDGWDETIEAESKIAAEMLDEARIIELIESGNAILVDWGLRLAGQTELRQKYFIRYLNSDNNTTRMYAALELAKVQNSKAIEILKAAVLNPEIALSVREDSLIRLAELSFQDTSSIFLKLFEEFRAKEAAEAEWNTAQKSKSSNFDWLDDNPFSNKEAETKEAIIFPKSNWRSSQAHLDPKLILPLSAFSEEKSTFNSDYSYTSSAFLRMLSNGFAKASVSQMLQIFPQATRKIQSELLGELLRKNDLASQTEIRAFILESDLELKSLYLETVASVLAPAQSLSDEQLWQLFQTVMENPGAQPILSYGAAWLFPLLKRALLEGTPQLKATVALSLNETNSLLSKQGLESVWESLLKELELEQRLAILNDPLIMPYLSEASIKRLEKHFVMYSKFYTPAEILADKTQPVFVRIATLVDHQLHDFEPEQVISEFENIPDFRRDLRIMLLEATLRNFQGIWFDSILEFLLTQPEVFKVEFLSQSKWLFISETLARVLNIVLEKEKSEIVLLQAVFKSETLLPETPALVQQLCAMIHNKTLSPELRAETVYILISNVRESSVRHSILPLLDDETRFTNQDYHRFGQTVSELVAYLLREIDDEEIQKRLMAK